MNEKKYRYKGQDFSEGELREIYGDKFDEKISLFEVIEPQATPSTTYEYKGNEFTESELREIYGDKFDDKVALFKKKDTTTEPSEITSETSSTEQPQESQKPQEDTAKSEFGVENILSPELQAQKKEMKEDPFKTYLSGKFVTPNLELDKLEAEVKSYEDELKNIPKSLPNYKTDRVPSAKEIENERKRYDLIQKRADAEKRLNKALTDNNDIYAEQQGYEYIYNDQPLSRSQFYKKITSNEFKNAVNEGKTPSFNVKGDDLMKEQADIRKAAAKISEGERRGRSILAGIYESTISPALQTFQDVVTEITSPETGASIADSFEFFISRTPSNRGKAALERAKKKGGDLEDNFQMEYNKSLKRDIEQMRGLQIETEEDVINQFQQGNWVEGFKDLAQISLENSGYMAQAMIPYVGWVMVTNSVRSNTYYDLRREGVSKEKAAAVSIFNGVVDGTLETIGGKILLGNTFKNGIKATNKAKLRGVLPKAQEKTLIRKFGENIAVEGGTEFLQETTTSATNQWAKTGKVDIDKAFREGAIGALSGSTTAGGASLISTGRYGARFALNTIDKYNEINKAEKAIQDVILKVGEVESDSDRKVLKSQAKELINDYLEMVADNDMTLSKASNSELSLLKELTIREGVLEKTVDNRDISGDTKQLMQSKLDKVREDKKSLLNRINDRTLFEGGKPTVRADQAVIIDGEVDANLEGIEPISTSTVMKDGEQVERRVYSGKDLIDNGLANDANEEVQSQEQKQEEPMLEGVRDGRNEEEGGQESPELRTEEKEEVVKLSPAKFVGKLTSNLKEKGGRKRLRTPMGDIGYSYTNNGVEVVITDDFEFGEVDGEEQQADILISSISLKDPSRGGEGLASRELDRVLSLADERGMSVALTVDVEGATMGVDIDDKSKILTNEQLKKWYKGRGFKFDEYSSYGYRKPKVKTQEKELTPSETDTITQESGAESAQESQEAAESVKSTIGIESDAKRFLKQKKERAPKKGFTTKQLLSLAEKQDKRGIREGKRQERVNISEFKDNIKSALKEVPSGVLTNRQSAQLAKAAAGVRTPSQLRRFEETATRIIDSGEYAEKLGNAQSIQSKIKTRSKQKGTPSNLTKVMADFAKIEPNQVPDIDQYLFYANEVFNIAGKASVSKGEVKQPRTLSVDEIYKDYIDKHNSLTDQEAKRDMLDDFQYLLEAGIIDESMSKEDIESVIDSIYTADEISEDGFVNAIDGNKNAKSRLEKLIDYKIMELEQIPIVTLSRKSKEQINILKNSNIQKANLTSKELGELYLYIQNFIQNGKLNNIASVTSKLAASESLNEILTDDYKPRKWIDVAKGLSFSLMNMTQLYEAIAGGAKLGAKIYKSSFVYDYAESKVRAENRFTEKIKDFNEKFKDFREVKSSEDKFERMVYGFLSQVPSEKWSDAIDYIDESISYHESGELGQNSKIEANDFRRIFNEKVKGAKSISDIKISDRNKRIINWFRNAFLQIKDEYFENAEIVHNKSLEEQSAFGMYLPFVSRSKSGNVDTKNQESIDNPSTLLDNIIIPNRSGSVNTRKNQYNSRNRYMPFDFERSMFQKLDSHLKDIETSFAIKKISALFRNPRSIELLGNASLRSSFFDRTKEYVNESWAGDGLGVLENAAFKVMNTISNWSGRVALGGFSQFPKQTISVLVNTSIQLGSTKGGGVDGISKIFESMYDLSSNEFADKIIQDTPVYRRSFIDQDTRRIYSSIPASVRKTHIGKIMNAFQVTEKVADDIMMFAIQRGDKFAAQASWLAYYKDYLGSEFKGWESESKNPNKDARAFADLMINNTQNVNDIDMQATAFKVKQEGTRRYVGLIRRTALPFMSFKLNQVMDEVVQASKIGNNTSEAAKRIGGRLGELMTFHSISMMIYGLYGSMALGLLGLTGVYDDDEMDEIRKIEDKDEDKDKKAFFSILSKTVLEGTVPFYGFKEEVDQWMTMPLNRFYFFNVLDEEKRNKYIGKSTKELARILNKDPEKYNKLLQRGYSNYIKNGRPPIYVPRDNGEVDFGMLTIGLSNYINDYKGIEAALSAKQNNQGQYVYKYESKSGNEIDIELTKEERDALIYLSFAQTSDIILPNDIASIARKAEQKIFSKKFDAMFPDKKKKGKSMFNTLKIKMPSL